MKRKWLIRIAAASAVLLLGTAAFGVYTYDSVRRAASEMYEPLPHLDAGGGIPAVSLSSPEPDSASFSRTALHASQRKQTCYTVLLLGVDERQGDRGRADTMMVMTFNMDARKSLLFSIPRDTLVRLAFRNISDKINHAYAFEGVKGAVATVETFLDVPIDYYVKVNMDSFRAIVDVVGGIDVDNALAFRLDGSEFPKGRQHLNGNEALRYIRMRYDDPKGDLGRTGRQRQVVRELLRKAKSWNGMLELPKLLRLVQAQTKTNLTYDDMIRLMKAYGAGNMETTGTEIRGSGSIIGGIYYFMVDNLERRRLHDAVNSLIDLSS